MTEVPGTRPAEPGVAWAPTVVAEQDGLFPWWSLLLLGAASTLFGIVVLAWPHVSLKVMAVLVGIWLLLAGIVRIIGAFLPGRGVGRQVLSGIVGVVLVIGGVACLRDLANGLAILAFLVALTWLFSGLSELVVAFQATGAFRLGLGLLGVLSIVAGLVFVFTPNLSLAVLVLMTGISAIVIGLGELVVAFQLRKVRA
jgi:uncharacterized membrane protein HdeD (DUF308 family)